MAILFLLLERQSIATLSLIYREARRLHLLSSSLRAATFFLLLRRQDVAISTLLLEMQRVVILALLLESLERQAVAIFSLIILYLLSSQFF